MSRKASRGGGTPALVVLEKAGVPHTLHTYEHAAGERHFGDETVAALGVDPSRVFKTLLVACEPGPALAVGIVPVSGQLDLKAIARALGARRAAMADPAVAERTTGYVVGGISPLGQKRRLPTVLDASALGLDSMLVSGGRRGLQVELAAADLVALVDAVVAPIAG